MMTEYDQLIFDKFYAPDLPEIELDAHALAVIAEYAEIERRKQISAEERGARWIIKLQNAADSAAWNLRDAKAELVASADRAIWTDIADWRRDYNEQMFLALGGYDALPLTLQAVDPLHQQAMDRGGLWLDRKVESVTEVAMPKQDPVITDLEKQIDRCEAIMSKTRKVWDKPFEALGAFDTGASNRPKSLDRMVDAENKRKSEAFEKYQTASKKLAGLQARLNAYRAGEVHANGQIKVNAPSRQKVKTRIEQYGEYIRVIVKPGDAMAVAFNPCNSITVKRINQKSITSESGSKWTFDELLPMVDGKPMTAQEFSAAVKSYLESVQ